MPAELVADGIGCVRGGRTIIDDYSISVGPGELVAVTGPSGSGKSTLLMLLSGLEPPDRGTVTFDSAPVRIGVDVALVLQSYGLLSLLTAAENIEVVLQARGVSPEEVRARAADALAALGLTDHAGRLVDELSGGQQQRVAIARALAVEPAVVLADEPTAELDPDNQAVVMAALHGARRRGAIVIIATHDPDIAAQCTRTEQLTPPPTGDVSDVRRTPGSAGHAPSGHGSR
jgi:ABC-type lipoprotein export system ATPase subunit